MTAQQRWALLAAAGSAALMIGALAFQHLGGMPPCKLCIWQRWPHVIAIAIGLLVLLVPNRLLMYLGALAAASTAVIGIYHSGVEWGFWEGPASCSSTGVSGLSTQELMDQIMAAPLVRCDEIPWQMLGLSMAGWNAVIAIGLMFIWLKAARTTA